MQVTCHNLFLGNLLHGACKATPNWQHLPSVAELLHVQVCILMDYYERGDLATAIARQQQPFAEQIMIQWIVSVLSGLKAMHTHTPIMVHRDLKPANLLLASDMQSLVIGQPLVASSSATESVQCGR